MNWLWFAVGFLGGAVFGMLITGMFASSKMNDLLDANYKLTVWNQKLRDKLYGGKNV